MLAAHVRLIAKCVIFLLLMSAFIAIEFRLRGKPSDGTSFTAAFAALLVASLFCSAALSHIITKSFDSVWAMFEEPDEESPEKERSSGGSRSGNDILIDIEPEPFSDEEIYISDDPIPLSPMIGLQDGFYDEVNIDPNGNVYYSPENEAPVLLPPGEYICEDYTEEFFELYYENLELTMDVSISESDCFGFETVKDYYEHFRGQYRDLPDFYSSPNPKAGTPYYVLSYRSEDEDRIYYEVTYHPEAVWHSVKFSYPVSRRETCDQLIANYIGVLFLNRK